MVKHVANIKIKEKSANLEMSRTILSFIERHTGVLCYGRRFAMHYLNELGLGDICKDEEFFMYMASISGAGGLTFSNSIVISSLTVIARN